MCDSYADVTRSGHAGCYFTGVPSRLYLRVGYRPRRYYVAAPGCRPRRSHFPPICHNFPLCPALFSFSPHLPQFPSVCGPFLASVCPIRSSPEGLQVLLSRPSLIIVPSSFCIVLLSFRFDFEGTGVHLHSFICFQRTRSEVYRKITALGEERGPNEMANDMIGRVFSKCLTIPGPLDRLEYYKTPRSRETTGPLGLTHTEQGRGGTSWL